MVLVRMSLRGPEGRNRKGVSVVFVRRLRGEHVC
jgi:hypothetical protein